MHSPAPSRPSAVDAENAGIARVVDTARPATLAVTRSSRRQCRIAAHVGRQVSCRGYGIHVPPRRPTLHFGPNSRVQIPKRLAMFNWIKKAARAAAGAIASAVNNLAQVVSATLEEGAVEISSGYNKTASAARSMIDNIGRSASNVPIVGRWLSLAVAALGNGIYMAIRWIGLVLSGVVRLAATVVKGLGSVLGGMGAGLVLILGGTVAGDFGLVRNGLFTASSGVGGALLVIAGKTAEIAQSVLGVQSEYRLLTADETKFLERVFWRSVPLEQIKVVEGRAGIFSMNHRAFALGNTIFLKNRYSEGLLVHECTHVWQYQHFGPSYASDALAAQQFVESPYNWRLEVFDRSKDDWRDFNREAQAAFLEDIYNRGELSAAEDGRGGVSTTRGRGVFYDADGEGSSGHFDSKHVTAIAHRAVALVRGATWIASGVGHGAGDHRGRRRTPAT